MSDTKLPASNSDSFDDASARSREASIADETAGFNDATAETEPGQMSDAELIKLAEAERAAGVPDRQAAQAAAGAQQRTRDDAEVEAHPS